MGSRRSGGRHSLRHSAPAARRGRFQFNVSLTDGARTRRYRSVEKAAEFSVIPQGEAQGLVLFEGDWSLEPAARAVRAHSGAPDDPDEAGNPDAGLSRRWRWAIGYVTASEHARNGFAAVSRPCQRTLSRVGNRSDRVPTGTKANACCGYPAAKLLKRSSTGLVPVDSITSPRAGTVTSRDAPAVDGVNRTHPPCVVARPLSTASTVGGALIAASPSSRIRAPSAWVRTESAAWRSGSPADAIS
jgi:hypothetical protein